MVMEAIKVGGKCTQLRCLDLERAGLKPAHATALAEAMRGGGLPRLEELILRNNEELGDAGVVSLMGALEAKACPYLKKLVRA